MRPLTQIYMDTGAVFVVEGEASGHAHRWHRAMKENEKKGTGLMELVNHHPHGIFPPTALYLPVEKILAINKMSEEAFIAQQDIERDQYQEWAGRHDKHDEG